MELSQGPRLRLVSKEGLTMLLMGLLIIAGIAVMGMLSSDNREKVMDDFCKVECKQNIRGKYKFCC